MADSVKEHAWKEATKWSVVWLLGSVIFTWATWDYIKRIAVWLWHFSTAEVTTYRWVYWLLLLIVLALVVLAVAITVTNIIQKEHAPPEPSPFDNYVSDSFYGIKWRWQWNGNEVIELTPMCPDCDRLLDEQGISWEHERFSCPVCRFNSQDFGSTNARRLVFKEIELHVRSQTWKSRVG